MLETIREFALDEIEGAAYGDVRRRHAGYYLEVAETAAPRLQGPEHARSLSRLIDELDNIRVALDWMVEDDDSERLARLAAAMATYWRYYGDIREGQGRLRQATAHAAQTSQPTQARILRAAGWLEVVAGNLQEGQRLLERSLSLFEAIGDDTELATTLYHLGACLSDQQRPAAARRRLERGLAYARNANAVATQGRLLGALVEIARNANRREEAAELLRQGIEASTRAGDWQRLGLLYNWAGWQAWETGNRDEATARRSESLRLLREWGERAFLGGILLVVGRAYREFGDLETARAMLVEGIQLIRQAGAIPDVVAALAEAAGWLDGIGARDRAIFHWQAAEEIAEAHGVDPSLSWPLPDVRRALRDMVATSARPSLPDAQPISLEQALDDAEADVSAASIPEDEHRARRRASPSELTPREREVLQLIVAGQSNAEIGEALFISRKTASVHVANIKDKLGAPNRVGIVTIALTDHLTDLPSPDA
jgi:DNA-binding CsgD family transcriptional regulator/Tfp pilus assembly protein PilF